MSQIGNVPEINKVKIHLDNLRKDNLIQHWEMPYENILTRLTAAIFFLTPTSEAALQKIWDALKTYPMIQYRLNDNKALSDLEWRVEFNKGFEI